LRRNKKWSEEERHKLKHLVEDTNMSWKEVGAEFGVDGEIARDAYRHNNHGSYAFNKIAESPYPKFDNALEQSGDCLVIPDVEFPYHNADFLNHILELADSWGVKNCNLAGDVMHFNSISKWEANWKATHHPAINDDAEAALMATILRLPGKYQQTMLDTLSKFANAEGDDVGSEVKVANKALTTIGEMFDDVVYVIGNHDGRLLSALNSPMFAEDLKRFVVGDNPKFRIAEFYYSTLHTDNGDYSIEHPVSAAKTTAVNIAIQKHCHVLMAHSHRFSVQRDPSDKYWCIQMGCAVDEERLAYVAQRTRGAEKHSTGATIIRGGYPYNLSPETPWELWKRL
jgi:hypothetical protein